jgi:thiol-disulfide isomerase/thioredoxin
MIFFLSLRVNLTNSAWNRISKTSDSPPLFILAFTPWCGHCRALMPAWRKLAADLASDPTIVIASLNCTRDGALCGTFGIRGYPTFLNFFKGKFENPRLRDRSYSAFAEEANRIKNSAKGEFKIGKLPPWVEYPSFIAHVAEDDVKSREIVKTAAEKVGIEVETRIFFDAKNGTNAAIEVLLGKDLSIEMTDHFSLQSVTEFLAEHRISSFGDWTFEQISGMKRLFGIYYPKEGKDPPKEIVKWAEKNAADLVFGSFKAIGRARFEDVFQTKAAQPPIVVFLKMKKRSFAIIESVNVEALDTFIDKYKHKRVTMMKLNASALPALAPENEDTPILRILIIIGSIILVAVLFHFVRQQLTAKQD